MRILCVFGRHNYGDPARGEGVEYSQFIPALEALGHQVVFFESFSRAGYRGFDELNRALLKRVEVERPDVVLTVLMMAEVWLETIALMRETGVKVANWSTDDSWKYAQFARLIAKDFDAFATTCPDAPAWYARDGISHCIATQWAAAARDLAAPLPAAQCSLDVSFVGSCYGKRAARIDSLRSAGIAVECFGHGWPNGPVDASRMRSIMRDSRVSLNFSEGGGGTGQQIKARVFEVPGAGGLLVTESAPHLERYFEPGREIAAFGDDRQLIDIVRSLLLDPGRRDAMARAGHARVQREHTYEHRLAALLDALPSTPVSQDHRDVEWQRFEAAVRRHQCTAWLRALRAVLVGAASLIWGRSRGPRAARRMLFELCWRVSGRRTYTAAGLPGRLFYRES